MTNTHGGGKKDRRPDSPALHEMPSANAHDPIIVNTPARHGLFHHCARGFAIVSALIILLVLGALVLLESGAADGSLTGRAQALLQNAAGDQYQATVDHTRLRLAKHGMVALEARDVGLRRIADGVEVIHAAKARIALQILPLLSGQLKISHIEIEGGLVNAASGGGTGGTTGNAGAEPFEIADLEPVTDRALTLVQTLSATLEDRETRSVFLSDMTFEGVVGRSGSIAVSSAEIASDGEGGLNVEAGLEFAGQDIQVTAEAAPSGEQTDRMQLDARVTGVHLGKMIRELSDNPERKFRLESDVEIQMTALSRGAGQASELNAVLDFSAGDLFMDGVAAELKPSRIRLAMDTKRKSIEIEQSQLDIGKSSYSFNGGIIDLHNLPDQTDEGIAIDLLVNRARVAPTDSTEPPVNVAMKAFGRFVRAERRLYVDEFIVRGREGSVFSSASVQFSDTSPEISFVANIDRMDTASVKQLWPYWIAKMARSWVLDNLFGGTVNDGQIRVFIPEGRMAKALPNALHLDDQQLLIDFNIENARFDVAGDIPPVRNADGLLTLRGNRLELKIDKGSSYFASGRSVDVANGHFVIGKTNARPLMAELDIEVSGEASAVAELISYRPISALQRTPYKVDDFEGTVSSKVHVVFGLVQKQNPPSPVWDVDLDLDGVSIGPEVDGVKVTNATGKMHVDTTTIRIDAQAELNGIQSQVDFTEPLEAGNGVESDRTVKFQVSEADREEFAPQLNELVKGTVFLTAKLGKEGRQAIDADFTEARLILPWIGWSKGKGIKATATFELVPIETGATRQTANAQAEEEARKGLGLPGAFTIKDFDLKGEGFSAAGNLEMRNGQLIKADISRASLSRDDAFSVDLTRNDGTYSINVEGEAVDLRSSIKHLLADTQGESGGEAAEKVELRIRTDRAIGFGGETVQPFKMDYVGRGNTILGLDLQTTTRSGEKVDAVGKHDGSGLILTISSDDAGAAVRFADIYSKIQGGTLDIELARSADGPYVGTVDINDFSVVDDENLQKLVSTRPQGGESLNEAVRRDIDVSRAYFQYAFARIDMGDGFLHLSDGVARGTEVGFAFQGDVYDRDTGMDITGTFMPAYGLNRIFGEIPVLGVILGNGRDRGLIGITFRLTGSFDDPTLAINPISLIAPGIFRSIFQFRNDSTNVEAEGQYNFRSESR